MSTFTDNHKKMADRPSVVDALRSINDKINGCGFNFQVDKNENGFISYPEIEVPENALIVLSSFDFCYYHNLEIVFYDVLFTDLDPGDMWWDHWEKDQLALNEEYTGEGFEFYFTRGTHTDIQLIVRAKSFSFHFGTVYYYNRNAPDQSGLEPGQRVAWWVSR
jgi:hypothetical protein